MPVTISLLLFVLRFRRFGSIWAHAYYSSWSHKDFKLQLVKSGRKELGCYLIQQILTNSDSYRQKKIKQHLGEKIHYQFCYLPTSQLQIKFLPLLERKPAKIFKKQDKVGHKTAYKKKGKGKKRERVKRIEIESQK